MRYEDDPLLFGIVGYPLRHSLSPLLHNSLFKHMRLNAFYGRFETQDIRSVLVAMRALKIKGLSITIPFKETVLGLVDELDPVSKRMGAVNTILYRGKKVVGFNTDAPGAMMAIEEVMDPKGASCLIIGAGGTGGAIARALREKGCQVFITNRTISKGISLAEAVGGKFVSVGEIHTQTFDLVVQATPVGMFPNTDSWALDPCKLRTSVAMDVVYNPLMTKFLKGCELMGAKLILGYKMFLYQAALQVRLFLDVDPPIPFMEKTILEALNGFDGDSQKV